MKYYDQLSKLETELIRLDTVSSLVSVITAGVDSSNLRDLQNSLYLLEDVIKSTNENIRQEFDELWDIIRTDTQFDDEEVNFDDDELSEEQDDLFSESEKPTYDFTGVEKVVKTWIEP